MAGRNMTAKEFEQKIKELVKFVSEKAIPFENDNPEKQQERIKRAKADLIYFAKSYFPHYVTSEFAGFHIEELTKAQNALDSGDATVMSEIWSRGFGKSSQFGIIFPIWAGITKKSMFTIFTGVDRNLSKERTVSLRVELSYNARIKHDYEEMVMCLTDGEETDFDTPSGVRYIALGYKQAVRGRVHGRHRPRLIIVDDLENHMDTNPKIADAKYLYVMEEAFGAFGPKGGLIVWLGNLTNSASALHKFVTKCDDEPDNRFIGYRLVKALDEDGHSNWPDAYPDHILEAKKSVMGKAGFDRHYMMKPGIDGDVFKADWFRFYNPYMAGDPETLKQFEGIGFNMKLPTVQELERALTVSYCDPSLGGGESNDFKCIVTVAFWGGLYYIRDVVCRKMTLLEMIDVQYSLDKRFKTIQFMEKNFWQTMIWQYMPQKADEYGYMLPIRGIDNRLPKNDRILSLQPLFQLGHIVHCVVGNEWDLMKEQLVGFPNAGYDDAPDALAGAIQRFRELANVPKYESIERGRSYDGFM